MHRRNTVDIIIAGMLDPEFPFVSATLSSVCHAQDEYEGLAFCETWAVSDFSVVRCGVELSGRLDSIFGWSSVSNVVVVARNGDGWLESVFGDLLGISRLFPWCHGVMSYG